MYLLMSIFFIKTESELLYYKNVIDVQNYNLIGITIDLEMKIRFVVFHIRLFVLDLGLQQHEY